MRVRFRSLRPLFLCPISLTSSRVNPPADSILGKPNIWKSVFDIISLATPRQSEIEVRGGCDTSRNFQPEATR
jgi:hypothetical protein